MNPLTRLTLTMLLPAAAVWGGLKLRYDAPESYENPDTSPPMAQFEREHLDWNGIKEQDFREQHPDNTSKLKKNYAMNLRDYLELWDLLGRAHPESYSDERHLYYTDDDATDGIDQNYTLTLKTSDLQELQDYTDSLCFAHHSFRPTHLKLAFEGEKFPLEATEGQAVHSRTAHGIDTYITLFAKTLGTRTKDEIKASIGHELAHKILRHEPTEDRALSIRQEFAADSLGLLISGDADAALSDLGKSARQLNITTLLDEFSYEVLEWRGKLTHPPLVKRAQRIERIAKMNGME